MGKPTPSPRGTSDVCPECYGEDSSALSILPNDGLLCRCNQCGAEWVQ